MKSVLSCIVATILAITMMLGAHHGVKFAISASPASLKWFLFVMTLCGSAAAFYF